MLAYFRFELRRLRRDPRLLLFAVLTPVVSYVVFSGVTIRSADPASADLLARIMMIGLAGYGAVFGALSVGVSVSQERSTGWLRQLRSTPLAPSRVVAVRAVLATLTGIPPVVAIGLTGYLQHGVTLPLGTWASVVGLLWLGTVPFALLGLAIGYGLSPQVAQPVSFLCFFLLSVLGGLLVPINAFPVLLQRFADALPTFRYAELGWRAVAGDWPGLPGVAILLGWALVFAAAAAWTYRRFAAVH
jgi:ABC-2 type transport system permease protein